MLSKFFKKSIGCGSFCLALPHGGRYNKKAISQFCYDRPWPRGFSTSGSDQFGPGQENKQVSVAEAELAVPPLLVVQLFASQVEGKMYIYELYGPNYFLAETIILRVTLGSVEFWASTVGLWHVEGAWMNLSDEWDGSNRELQGQGHIKKMGNPIPLGSLIHSSPTLSGSFGFLLYSLRPLSLPL